MIAAPSEDWPVHPVYPRRRTGDAPAVTTVESYLAALEQSLAGQIDPALEANGIYTPLGSVARAALVEAIGADLEAAARDLMLQGVPRDEAEHRAIAQLGPAPDLGRDLLIARRRQAVEAWQRGKESVWWWTEPLVPVAITVCAVLMAAVTPTLAIIAGMAAEPHLGALAVAMVPLVGGVLMWATSALAPGIGDPPNRN
jgi:hypothetical protein